MTLARVLAAAGLALVLLASASVALAAGRVALVVGNSTYSHIARLPNPENDAADIAAALQRLGFEVTTAQDADRTSLNEALRVFTRESVGAGHGARVLRRPRPGDGRRELPGAGRTLGGDTTTLVDTLVTAAEQVEAVGAPGIAEVVADKGYHSNETMVGCGHRRAQLRLGAGPRPAPLDGLGGRAGRGVCQPPADPRRTRETAAAAAGRAAGTANAHLYETGRMRRVHLRGHPNILKRLLVQVCGVNLGLLMRHLTGVGTPRSLQGRASALVDALIGLLSGCWERVLRFWAPERQDRPDSSWGRPATRHYGHAILD